jgi:small subunit ribosomal protein S16
MTDKTGKIQAKKDRLAKSKSDNLSAALKHEREVNEARLKAMTAAAAEASAAAVEAPVAEAPAAEAPEAPAAEESADSAEA